MNKYLEKIANDHIIEGLVSPAWQQKEIAHDHGKTGPEGWDAYGAHLAGSQRAGWRGVGHGLMGGLGGAAIGALIDRHDPRLALGLGLTGYAVGGAHGIYTSLKNQAHEAHEKYSK